MIPTELDEDENASLLLFPVYSVNSVKNQERKKDQTSCSETQNIYFVYFHQIVLP